MSSLDKHSRNWVCLLLVRTLRPRVSPPPVPVPEFELEMDPCPEDVRSLAGRSGDLMFESEMVLDGREGVAGLEL